MNGLTYFVELGAAGVLSLFVEEEGLLDGLSRSGASIAMAMLDLSTERASAIRLLNQRGVDVSAWLILDAAEGYWFTADNVEVAAARYREVRSYFEHEGLAIKTIGLDVEAPHEDARALVSRGSSALRQLFIRRRSPGAIHRAIEQYAALIGEIRRDGFTVETYQFPLIADERRARSTLLQRVFGIVDMLPDREVMMLYRSLLPHPIGAAMVDAYGKDADAIAVGITGGGVDFVDDVLDQRRLTYDELLFDLRRAARYTDELYVFSLEGCVKAGYFERLCDADLARPTRAAALAAFAPALRALLRRLLRAERLLDRVVPSR